MICDKYVLEIITVSLTITLANEVSEYGMYVLSIPQGTVATAGGQLMRAWI